MIIPSIAILILAHKNQEQLYRLVNHLKSDFTIYIHIDNKSKIQIFKDKNVHSIKKFKVYWGGYSQILATRELMKIAAANKHDRYLLVSGQDLPVKSNRQIINFFTDNHNNYLEADKLPSSWWTNKPQGGLQKLRYYYCNYYNPNRKIQKRIIRIAERFLHRFQDLLMLQRKHPCNLYGGSNWFNLTHEAVEICLQNMFDPQYMKSYKYSRNGDEIIINSIIYNSKLSLCCVNDDLRYTNMDYDSEPPNMITEKDLEIIKESNKLFARKFDDSFNPELIDKVYSSLT